MWHRMIDGKKDFNKHKVIAHLTAININMENRMEETDGLYTQSMIIKETRNRWVIKNKNMKKNDI